MDEATQLRTPALADCTDSQFPVSGFEQWPPISKEPTFPDLPILAISLRLETRDWNRKLETEN